MYDIFSTDGHIKVFLPDNENENQFLVSTDHFLQPDEPELGADKTASTINLENQEQQKENKIPNDVEPPKQVLNIEY